MLEELLPSRKNLRWNLLSACRSSSSSSSWSTHSWEQQNCRLMQDSFYSNMDCFLCSTMWQQHQDYSCLDQVRPGLERILVFINISEFSKSFILDSFVHICLYFYGFLLSCLCSIFAASFLEKIWPSCFNFFRFLIGLCFTFLNHVLVNLDTLW